MTKFGQPDKARGITLIKRNIIENVHDTSAMQNLLQICVVRYDEELEMSAVCLRPTTVDAEFVQLAHEAMISTYCSVQVESTMVKYELMDNVLTFVGADNFVFEVQTVPHIISLNLQVISCMFLKLAACS